MIKAAPYSFSQVAEYYFHLPDGLIVIYGPAWPSYSYWIVPGTIDPNL